MSNPGMDADVFDQFIEQLQRYVHERLLPAEKEIVESDAITPAARMPTTTDCCRISETFCGSRNESETALKMMIAMTSAGDVLGERAHLGRVLPLRRVVQDGARRWQSGRWFFRGDGPDGFLSGAALKKRFERPGSALSTFFEDNYAAWLLDARPGRVLDALVEQELKKAGAP